jgi:hypothetical protein
MLIDLKTSKGLIEHLARINGNLDKQEHKGLLDDNDRFIILLRSLNADATRDLHPTEQKYPEQTERFREILDEMYQTHLKKNADYSAYNINGTGSIGLVVRFWDKCARLMNLCGFDIGTGNYTGMKKNLVMDESIVDTVMDAAVYSIIFKIYNEGKWGK